MAAVKKNFKCVEIERENEKDDTVDTSSIKHEISHFYVASRPSRSYRKGKEMYTKKRDAHAESLFCSFR